jgi:hypothetical protein
MTGIPDWNAISAFWEAVADRYGSTKASAAAKTAGTSAVGTYVPGMVTRSCSPRSEISRRRSSRPAQISPATESDISGPTSASARSRMSSPL